MAFALKNDLSISILIQELDEITRADDALITEALSRAESEARGYLYDSYDVDTIFAQSGSSRHAMLLQCVTDIAIYRIVAACQAGIDLTDREERYMSAIRWLKMVQKSELYGELPRRTETKQEHVSWGSQNKRSNRF